MKKNGRGATLIVAVCFLSIFGVFYGPSAFAAGSPSAVDQKLSNGLNQCIENISSCTNTQKLSEAWDQGMTEAQTSLQNFLNLLWSLIRQKPIPSTPTAPPGMPPLPSYPIVETMPAPSSPTGTPQSKTP